MNLGHKSIAMYKALFALMLSLFISFPTFGQRKKILEAVNTEGVAATHVNVPYDTHKRNVLDIWLVEGSEASPLVVYIHGGGFMNGDKSAIYDSEDIAKFLEKGIAFASINYRFMLQQAERLPGCMKDSRRALQFLRSKAEEWKIDKDKIAVYGASAGAGTALWLGLHDDMADPNNEDSVLRESSRVSAIGALATQSTYDFTKWQEILDMQDISQDQAKGLLQKGAFALGFKNAEELESEEASKLRADVDFFTLLSKDDPPVFVYNNMRGGKIDPKDQGHINHHPKHALALKEAFDNIGHPSQVYAPELGIEPASDEQLSLVEFLAKYLAED